MVDHSAMLHCIQTFTNTCEVKMQVKHDIGKLILHKLPIYITNTCACVESSHYLARFVTKYLFSTFNKNSTTASIPI